MLLNLSSPSFTLTRLPLSPPPPPPPKKCSLFIALFTFSKSLRLHSSSNESGTTSSSGNPLSQLINQNLLSQLSTAKDANEALQIIADNSGRNGGTVSVSDCRSLIAAALDRNNPELALSLFYAMRSSFDQASNAWEAVDRNVNVNSVERWKWSRPDVHVYTLLIQGLATSLRVSDALRMIENICRVGVSPGEEVPFGKVVQCPSCMVAIAVAQPQHGVQIVSCAKCRYQYELISGNIVNIESEEISFDGVVCMG